MLEEDDREELPCREWLCILPGFGAAPRWLRLDPALDRGMELIRPVGDTKVLIEYCAMVDVLQFLWLCQKTTMRKASSYSQNFGSVLLK